MTNEARSALERLCLDRGEDFAGLSRMIGRNSAYIQQFIRRGVPRRLPEQERRLLASYFGVPEALLGGPEVALDFAGMVRVPALPVRASAGPGAFADDDERQRAFFAFDERWLKQLTGAAREELNLIRVEGDSMAPTLTDGDDILVDRGDSRERLRDGIYVLRIDDVLMVKRLALHPISRRVTVQSDNPAYADWPDCDPKDIDVIGRVIWSARRIA